MKHIHESMRSGDINGRIQFVFSNREPGEAEGSDRFFEQVREYGLPLVTISSRKFQRAMGGKPADNRAEYDRQVIASLEQFQPDVCVLAGYMRIVSKEMCQRYTMLNLHPALPDGPTGTWQEVIWSLMESKAVMTGSMVHLVTEDVDRGPVMAYSAMPIVGDAYDGLWADVEGKSVSDLQASVGEEHPLFKMVRQEGYRREPWMLGAALEAFLEGRIRVSDGQVYDENGSPSAGLCLDEEVDRALSRS